MRSAFCYLLLALIIPSGTNAGVAYLETSRGDGQWIVAASPNDLTRLTQAWSASVSALGGTRTIARCDDKGWVAAFYDNQTRSFGGACGYTTREQAENAAFKNCQSRGGSSCRRVFSGFDDQTWTDRQPADGQYHLRDIKDD